MYPPPPPRIWAPQVSICAFAAGVFTGGGGLKNQLKKVAIGVDTTCVASDNSGSETNAQGAVAIPSNLCLIPTILCGGAGSRLWPVSRELHPKPFIGWRMGKASCKKLICVARNSPVWAI